ncbi:MAG: PsbP-related protein [Candidatus Woykebacteria bacterium]
MPKELSHEADPEHVPDVVFASPFELKPRRVLVTLLIGAIIIALGFIGYYAIETFFLKEATPLPPIVIKSGTQTAQKATSSAKKSETTKLTKSFKDSFYNISFNYPENWEEKSKSEVEACQPSVGPKDIKNSGFSICEFGLSSVEDTANIPDKSVVSLRKSLTVGGKSAVRQVVTENSKDQVFAYVGGVTHSNQSGTLTIIGWSENSGLTTSEFVNLFDQILSTFKPLD